MAPVKIASLALIILLIPFASWASASDLINANVGPGETNGPKFVHVRPSVATARVTIVWQSVDPAPPGCYGSKYYELVRDVRVAVHMGAVWKHEQTVRVQTTTARWWASSYADFFEYRRWSVRAVWPDTGCGTSYTSVEWGASTEGHNDATLEPIEPTLRNQWGTLENVEDGDGRYGTLNTLETTALDALRPPSGPPSLTPPEIPSYLVATPPILGSSDAPRSFRFIPNPTYQGGRLAWDPVSFPAECGTLWYELQEYGIPGGRGWTLVREYFKPGTGHRWVADDADDWLEGRRWRVRAMAGYCTTAWSSWVGWGHGSDGTYPTEGAYIGVPFAEVVDGLAWGAVSEISDTLSRYVADPARLVGEIDASVRMAGTVVCWVYYLRTCSLSDAVNETLAWTDTNRAVEYALWRSGACQGSLKLCDLDTGGTRFPQDAVTGVPCVVSGSTRCTLAIGPDDLTFWLWRSGGYSLIGVGAEAGADGIRTRFPQPMFVENEQECIGYESARFGTARVCTR